MCVIAVCKYVRLTDEQVEQMFDANPQGGGAAWREVDEDGRTVVRWHKWLDKEDMKNYNLSLPLPYVLHFRVASQDASKAPTACHPFAVNEVASYDIEGATDGCVLFHNGYWTNWKENLKTLALSGAIKIPSGPWSDSRGLALAAHHLGLGFLEMVNEKVVTLGSDDDGIELFGAWQMIKNPDEEGNDRPIFVSNKTWEKTTTSFKEPVTGVVVTDRRHTSNVTTLARRDGGAAADTSFQRQNAGTPSTTAQRTSEQKEVQTEAQGTSSTVWENHVSRLCQGEGCTKFTRAGMVLNDRWYCLHCWSKQTQQRQLVGVCEVCHVGITSAKRIIDDSWICLVCWETNSKPRIHYTLSAKDIEQ